jgi:hypothetical protein
MKKIITVIALSAGLILSQSVSADAATKPPKPKANTAQEGTAAHESSESSTTQNKEATTTKVKKTNKVKKVKKAAAPAPMASSSTK